MFVAPHPRGHVAIGQPAHGWMCGQLARAWGNERFGWFEPVEEVCLAAEQHDTGWAEWELAPELDRASGLPQTFMTTGFSTRLAITTPWVEKLVAQSRYAALLVSMHHCSFFEQPSRLGRLREGGRELHAFLEEHAALQARLRQGLARPEAEITRNQRLIRAWDGLSHDIILGLVPATRTGVPAAGAERVALRVDEQDCLLTIDPWPFRAEQIVVRTEGRLLETTFSDGDALREALAEAPWIALEYRLAAPGLAA